MWPTGIGCSMEGIQAVFWVFEKVVLTKQNGPVLWLKGLHSTLFSSRAQVTFGFARSIRVVLCSCPQAKTGSQSVFAGKSAKGKDPVKADCARALGAFIPSQPPQPGFQSWERAPGCMVAAQPGAPGGRC